MLVGILSFILAVLTYVFPQLLFGRDVFLTGLCILSLALLLWRWGFGHLMLVPVMRERVYLIGQGERAKRIAEAIRARGELGMDVVGWAGEVGNDAHTRNSLGGILLDLGRQRAVDRVIVALADRRSRMPVQELLALRMQNIRHRGWHFTTREGLRSN